MNNQPFKKKLVLERDTLRTLRSDDLDGVHGGQGHVTDTARTGAIAGGIAGRAEGRPDKDKPRYDDTVYRHDRQTI